MAPKVDWPPEDDWPAEDDWPPEDEGSACGGTFSGSCTLVLEPEPGIQLFQRLEDD